MNDMTANRARSRAVRSAAQAHLVALREERIAKRKAARSSMAAPVADEAEIGTSADQPLTETDPVMDDVETLAPIDEAPEDAMEESDDVAALPGHAADDALEPELASTDEAEMAEAPESDPGPAIEAADGFEEPDDVAIADEIDDEDGEMADDLEDDAAPEPELSAEHEDEDVEEIEEESTDLADLPGIGPGLIWMLQSAGINSLADMAEADRELLRGKLGLVGELLDLDFWISAAADQVKS